MMRRFFLAILPLALATLSPAALDARGDDRAPTPEEQRALLDRVIASQHHDDAAIELYERIERQLVRKGGHDSGPAEDKTFRVVPTGTGTLRVQTAENRRPIDAELYRKQLRELEQALLNSLNPNVPRHKQVQEKFARRQRERAESVEATRNAFLYTWLGRETRDGRVLAKFRLEPNPAYKPTSRTTSLFAHVRGTAWVDEAAGQLARIEVEVFRNISFGGGVLGKVYRGSRVAMEQADVAPGIWLPVRYAYDFMGRKFLFGFELHEITEASNYHRIGPPEEALAAIRRELSQTATSNASH